MIALFIILGIILLISALLVIPIRFDISFNEEFVVKAKYLFLTFTLISPEDEEMQEEEKETEEDSEQQRKKKGGKRSQVKAFFNREGFFGFLDFLRDVTKLLSSKIVYLVKRTRISKFDLYLCVGGEDAAETAIQYGQVCAVAYNVFNLLFILTKCKNKRISVDLDYENKEYVVDFHTVLRARPSTIVFTALSAFFKSIPLIKRFLGTDKKTIKNNDKKVVKKS